MFIEKCSIFRTVAVAFVFTANVTNAEPVVIKSGNVIGSPLPGEMPHHMLQTQHDFAKLVSLETHGEVEIQILEGKREDIPVFGMPGMASEGEKIQATAVPSFFLPRVPELNILEIPYLFRDSHHAAKYPSSAIAAEFSTMIEERYQVKVIGHFLVAHHVGITSTDKPIVMPADFSGRHVNDDFESFAPMWANIKPAARYSIGFADAAAGALHENEMLDTSIGMLQNMFVQKQYTKFRFATIAPSFYTFFYTFMINRDVWNELSETQQAGVIRAAEAAQISAVDNERATAIYHAALNRSLGVAMHMQTADEAAEWRTEFSDKVRDGILEKSGEAEKLGSYIEAIKRL
jgi:TRAP-type C4-dicarboxylate transport system substrate-binding protein